MKNLEIIYVINKPHGIRNENGFLLFFPAISKFPEQVKRYNKEIEEQNKLADDLLKFLKDKK